MGPLLILPIRARVDRRIIAMMNCSTFPQWSRTEASSLVIGLLPLSRVVDGVFNSQVRQDTILVENQSCYHLIDIWGNKKVNTFPRDNSRKITDIKWLRLQRYCSSATLYTTPREFPLSLSSFQKYPKSFKWPFPFWFVWEVFRILSYNQFCRLWRRWHQKW